MAKTFISATILLALALTLAVFSEGSCAPAATCLEPMEVDTDAGLVLLQRKMEYEDQTKMEEEEQQHRQQQQQQEVASLVKSSIQGCLTLNKVAGKSPAVHCENGGCKIRQYQGGHCSTISLEELKDKCQGVMTSIDLASTNCAGHVSGDIENLREMTEVTKLSLSDNPRVHGNIGALSQLKNLKEVFLHYTGVNGSVGALSELTSLHSLRLDSTAVNGNIRELAKLTGLKHVNLWNTDFHGDIEGLGKLTDLEDVSLEDTKVDGMIEGLTNLTGLRELNLEGTKVQGTCSDKSDPRCLCCWAQDAQMPVHCILPTNVECQCSKGGCW